jgi:hypothetical protein
VVVVLLGGDARGLLGAVEAAESPQVLLGPGGDAEDDDGGDVDAEEAGKDEAAEEGAQQAGLAAEELDDVQAASPNQFSIICVQEPQECRIGIERHGELGGSHTRAWGTFWVMKQGQQQPSNQAQSGTEQQV